MPKIVCICNDTPFIGKNQQYHYLYRIDNLINNKYYYGIHSTKNLDDGYRGSGKWIKQAIKKYGVENFVKTIVKFQHDRTQLLSLEENIVNVEMMKDWRCYNAIIGGLPNGVEVSSRADHRKKVIELETGKMYDSIKDLKTQINFTGCGSWLNHWVSKEGYHYAL